MTGGSLFDAPDGTREEMLAAAYRALCTHGYADLTIDRIGEEFPKSQTLIYHHYDGKDELLLDLLEHVLDRFERSFPVEAGDDPRAHLEAVIDAVFETPRSPERAAFDRAMVELRGQAAHDERFRDHFTRSDRFFTDRLAAVIEAGIDRGQFEAADPQALAELLVTVFTGAVTRTATGDAEASPLVREQLEAVVRTLTG